MFMSNALLIRLQGITTALIVVSLTFGTLVIGGRVTQAHSAEAAETVNTQTPDVPAVPDDEGSPSTKEDYLILADATCAAFSANTFKILPASLTGLAEYLGELSTKARQLHDELSQIKLSEGDTRELVLVLDQIERSATGLSEAVKATGNTGEVAIEMAFEPSYAHALLGDLNAGIHAWRAGLRSCGPKPLETFEMNDFGEPLNSKLR